MTRSVVVPTLKIKPDPQRSKRALSPGFAKTSRAPRRSEMLGGELASEGAYMLIRDRFASETNNADRALSLGFAKTSRAPRTPFWHSLLCPCTRCGKPHLLQGKARLVTHLPGAVNCTFCVVVPTLRNKRARKSQIGLYCRTQPEFWASRSPPGKAASFPARKRMV